jgi:phytanoyl-CoA hydroxylase
MASAAARQVAARGFAVVPNFASPQQIMSLKAAAQGVVGGFVRDLPGSEKHSVFTTREQERKSDAKFLGSGDRVECFFEEGAVDPETGELNASVEPMLSVNKAGHALHELVPEFRSFVHGEKRDEYADMARALLRANRGLDKGESDPSQKEEEEALVVQDMYIFKQPRIGGEVTPHQDSTFLYTAPQMTCFGFWLALDDATKENGCLWAVPGSHRHGIVDRMVRRKPGPGGDADGTEFIAVDERDRAPWSSLVDEFGEGGNDPSHIRAADWEPLEVEAGTLVLLHGSLVHASETNSSDRTRHAYALHIASDAPDARWAPDNWLMRSPGNPFQHF